MTRVMSNKRAWRMNHFLDPDEAIQVLSTKREELEAFCGVFAQAPKFAKDQTELSAWIERFDILRYEMTKTAATVANLAQTDYLILMALNPRRLQLLKAELTLAAAQLEEAEALRYLLLKRD